MTNYNERFDDVLAAVYLAGTENGLSRRLTDAEEIMHRKEAFINGNHVSKEAKQAITSLVKELVAEAKPGNLPIFGSQNEAGDVSPPDYESVAHNEAIKEFEQNLLKALEEV